MAAVLALGVVTAYGVALWRAATQAVDPQIGAALIAAAVSLISLAGTVVVAVGGFRATRSAGEKTLEAGKQTLEEQHARTLNERFATAADKLGSDKPTIQLAGVYAMAGLADDWEKNRQSCINVLCGYLRMPYKPDPGEDAPLTERLPFQASREVRHTVIRVITNHLSGTAAKSWCGLNFDFTGVVFDGGSFDFAEFPGGQVSFDHRRGTWTGPSWHRQWYSSRGARSLAVMMTIGGSIVTGRRRARRRPHLAR